MRAVIFDLDGTLVDTVYGIGLLSGGYGQEELCQGRGVSRL